MIHQHLRLQVLLHHHQVDAAPGMESTAEIQLTIAKHLQVNVRIVRALGVRIACHRSPLLPRHPQHHLQVVALAVH